MSARDCETYPLIKAAVWRNGIASDYESGDCRFDPCDGHRFFFVFPLIYQCPSTFSEPRRGSVGSLRLFERKERLLARLGVRMTSLQTIFEPGSSSTNPRRPPAVCIVSPKSLRLLDLLKSTCVHDTHLIPHVPTAPPNATRHRSDSRKWVSWVST